jgi:hypothetical protein
MRQGQQQFSLKTTNGLRLQHVPEFLWILRVDKFDPHRPYQSSYSLQRTCEFREAAKGSNKSEARRQIAGESRGTDGKPTKSLHPTAF